ncbi:MAG TPA: Rne/Rng family ribonuclease [Candidatus Binataceae bacterium]|nr:Rne/Rng family ribonuclease [Candidatus Binataceae bacterium]
MGGTSADWAVKVKRDIIINASPLEVRVALLEDGALAEFYLEREQRGGLAGNIYKGRVTRVLPGMQAAFVDIGLEKAGFLHVSDFQTDAESLGSVAEDIGEGDVETEPVMPEVELSFDETIASVLEVRNGAVEAASVIIEEPEAPTESKPTRRHRNGRHRPRLPIEQQLKRGQEIIVQVAKEPMGSKGARLTSFISLPGRHLVYTPSSKHIGISRRIESAEERARLRSAVKELGALHGGFIVRTACEGVSKREIQRDVSFLTKLWSSIIKAGENSPPASLLYSDLDVALRIVRDLFSSDIDRLWCDDAPTFERIVEFVQSYMPRLRARAALYEAIEPIFDHFSIEPQIERALERKVWLKSGGYLVFDQAEALTAIDVNTGRFVGKRNQDETVLRTNLEAVEEVVKQLRLRNIGGIIIVDFIDMSREADRKRVTDALSQALKRDKARTSMLKISELGLVQMTRKRTRESLEAMLTQACPRCNGHRVVKSVATLAADVMRGIQRAAGRNPQTDLLVVKVNPEIARYLYDLASNSLQTMEERLGIKIVLRSSEGIQPGAFELIQATAAA